MMESPEKENSPGIAMEFPLSDGAMSCSPPTVPNWLRRRLTEPKTPPLSTVEEIETKLRHAHIRRQNFYDNLSSKARPKPRSPSRSSSDEDDLGQRLEAKLQAAEEKRLSILANARMRLARLDELRLAAKAEAEMRLKRESAELGKKVEMRVLKAEANRLLILRAHRQRRATLKERTSQSLLRRMARDNKYKERVRTAICHKRAAAEKKRLGLLEEEKTRARARALQVQKVASAVSRQREIERSELKNKLEDRLLRAKRKREEYLLQRGRPYDTTQCIWSTMHEQADTLSLKLARCWKKFKRQSKTTMHLAKVYHELNVNEKSVKSMPFEQLALLIQSAATLSASKAYLDRLESRYKLSREFGSAPHSSSWNDIDHLLKRVVSPKRKPTPRKSTPRKEGNRTASVHQTAIIPSAAKLSRYQVRIVLCAYMILGHPDAVISGNGEREMALVKSAEKFVKEFELLNKILLDRPLYFSSEKSHSDHDLVDQPTFRLQLAAFDSAWCSFLNSFVVWKAKDARSLEEDLVRAACHLELSMIQTCRMTSEGASGPLSYDMKAIQTQVSEDQKLLREKVLHLGGDAGIERMENAISETRTQFFNARERGNATPVSTLMSTPNSSSPVSLLSSDITSKVKEGTQKKSSVVRSLFRDEVKSKDVGSSASGNTAPQSSQESFDLQNVMMVNEYAHGEYLEFADTSSSSGDYQNTIMAKVKETVEKAFWDSIIESVKQSPPNYSRVVELMREVRDEISAMAPQSYKPEIIGAIDLEILAQVLDSENLDTEYLGQIMEFSLAALRKLSAPAYEDDLRNKHQQFMNELAQACSANAVPNVSHVVELIKGLHYVLEQIQELKQEISKARIRMLEPLLKGPQALNYLGKAFTSRHGQSSNALTALPLTEKWFSSVRHEKHEAWIDHTNSLAELTTEESSSSFLPSTSLRTGGSLFIKSSGNQSGPSSTIAKETNPNSECKGELIDLCVRLGLMKLVNKVTGLTEEDLPETMILNLPRLRNVQSQLQKIIVMATSLLILRQTLLSQRIVTNQAQLDSLLLNSLKKLSECFDSVAEAGVKEIIETLGVCSEKEGLNIEPMKDIMGRMLSKSLQEGDAIFIRVSQAVYLAERRMVLGGPGKQGKELAEIALQKVGAALLLEELVEIATVLVNVAKVSVNVHGPWYKKMAEA